MRKTVCKRLRKTALRIAPETKYTVCQKIKRYFTGKIDDKGAPVSRDVNKTTVLSSGYRHVYQSLKRQYRIACCAGNRARFVAFLDKRTA